MDVYELTEKVGGEVVCGRARVRRKDKYIVLGRITPEGMVMTEDGKAMVDALTNPKPETPAEKPVGKPKAKGSKSNEG